MESEDVCYINCLPDEIIVMILQYHDDYKDLVRFGMTCKRFKEIVLNNNTLWRYIFLKKFPEMAVVMQANGCEDFYNEVMEYYKLKRSVYSELMESTNLYYEKSNPIHFMDVCSLINPHALSRHQNYYYTIHILQGLISKAREITNTNRPCQPPYTLSELYYAKIALRYYCHVYLSLKWYLWTLDGKPLPLNVVSFFIQWVYNENMESEDLAHAKIAELSKKVEDVLTIMNKGQSATDENGKLVGLPPYQLFIAISKVLYKQGHIVSVTEHAVFDTLDIVEVLKNRIGHHIAVMAIYHALAEKFGVHCVFYVYTNHLFLMWQEHWNDPNCPAYIIETETGNLKPKRRCPYSTTTAPRCEYSETMLLECLCDELNVNTAASDWYKHNAVFLKEFLRNSETDLAYRDLLPSIELVHRKYDLNIQIPLLFKYIAPLHRSLFRSLFKMGASIRPLFKEVCVKKHPSHVKYAVGMICTHAQTDYEFVIMGWDYNEPTENGYSVESFNNMFNINDPRVRQPHYYVLTIDKFTRCLPQNLITDVKRPSRLMHLEDALASEFTHFDGFRYVPNTPKMRQYPDDDAIARMYKNFSGFK